MKRLQVLLLIALSSALLLTGCGKEEEEKLKNIIKDIYRYYGVSEEDKEKGSERFLMLATILEAV